MKVIMSIAIVLSIISCSDEPEIVKDYDSTCTQINYMMPYWNVKHRSSIEVDQDDGYDRFTLDFYLTFYGEPKYEEIELMLNNGGKYINTRYPLSFKY